MTIRRCECAAFTGKSPENCRCCLAQGLRSVPGPLWSRDIESAPFQLRERELAVQSHLVECHFVKGDLACKSPRCFGGLVGRLDPSGFSENAMKSVERLLKMSTCGNMVTPTFQTGLETQEVSQG